MSTALNHGKVWTSVSAPNGDHGNGWVNVGDAERLVSGVAGGALTLLGLRQRSGPGAALALVGGALVYRAFTGHCHLYEVLGIDTNRSQGPIVSVRAKTGIRLVIAFIINRPQRELYAYWHDFANLPRFMTHLESVTSLGPTTSRWTARGPLGVRVQWDAEIHNQEEGRLIAWRSLEGSEVDTAGSVHFESAPGKRGTLVRINLKYDPPAARAGAVAAWLLGEGVESQIREDLRRFKQLMEAGEVATIQGQTSCRARV